MVAQYVIDKIRFLLDFQKLIFKKFNLHCKRQLLGHKSRNGQHEWKKSCIVVGLPTKVLKTLMKT
jgi:hypothetical protein